MREHKDYSGVVVWLEPAAGTTVPPTVPGRAEMAQKDKTFKPHILPITAGTVVSFPNFDPIFHSAFSNFSGQLFDVGLYPPGTSRAVVFKRPGIVRVFCNIHPNMSAVIVVLPTPYFAISQPNGAFEISGIPPGTYRLHIFHERATPETLHKLERDVQVGSEPKVLDTVVISETGYLPLPHLNKFGKDYPATIDDRGVYPGRKK